MRLYLPINFLFLYYYLSIIDGEITLIAHILFFINKKHFRVLFSEKIKEKLEIKLFTFWVIFILVTYLLKVTIQ